ncbi:MAG: carbohydrate ABC transporter permease [Pseudomonadota bacterium]
MSSNRWLWLLYILLLLYAVVALMPFFWMLITSFKEQRDLFRVPPSFRPTLLYEDAPFRNYVEVWTRRDFVVYFRNSMIVSALAAIGQVITCSLAGYAFAKMELPGKNLLFAVVLATAFVPAEVTIIPEFLLMRQLGWIDTWLPLIVPSFLVGAFGTFMLREYFGALPDEYGEAAVIDGANPFEVFYKIYLPLAQPALVAIFVIGFINNWDELLRPLIFLNSPELFTVPLGLLSFFSQYEAAWHQLMAGSVISVLPLVLVYVVAQKYVLQGFMGGGVK